LCRKALEIHEQDIEKAELWLRAEAAKQGWERAEKVKVFFGFNSNFSIHFLKFFYSKSLNFFKAKNFRKSSHVFDVFNKFLTFI
jgi:hypothetical protein